MDRPRRPRLAGAFFLIDRRPPQVAPSRDPLIPPVMRVLLVLLTAAAVPAAMAQDLGETSFPNSGAAAAQGPFLQGLLLLHSFEYDDARDAFREAQAADPGFAMAAWGEAMTHNHPVWMRQDTEAGRAALASADRDGITDRERAYLDAAAVLFGDGPKDDRDDAYAEAMRLLAEAYPDDLDARAFYALALLGTAHEGRDFATYMRAAAILEDVFARNPEHPGAAHYLIHAYDDPVHAPLGLRPARAYAEIAPAASHALHMPSHIHLALGMWDEVAEMNDRSYHAALANSERRGGGLNGHGWHALAWWTYAELQRDNVAEAQRLLAIGIGHQRSNPTGIGNAYLVSMRGQIATDLSGPRAPDLDPFDNASPTVRMRDAYARALEAGQTQTGRAHAGTFYAAYAEKTDPTPMERAAEFALRGMQLLDTDYEGALELLRQAAELEQASPLTFGPPEFAVPPTEAYGSALAGAGRFDAAVEAFRQSLARAPGRTSSLRLLWLVAKRDGDLTTAADAERQLQANGVGLD